MMAITSNSCKTFGVPYMGSKNKIAQEIAAALPPSECFVDLFAGGCAITHAAMLTGKWSTFLANDISDIPKLFKDAIDGKYHDERRWISCEDFFALKDTDPYVRTCWSFGNDCRTYMYAPEVERFKKWLHMMFFAETPQQARLTWRQFVAEFARVKEDIARITVDVEHLCNECSVEVSRRPDGTINAAKIKDDVFRVLSADIREYMREALRQSGKKASDVDKLLGTNGMAGHYFGASQWELPSKEAYEKMRTIMPALKIPWASLHKSLERIHLERLQSLESLQSLERLTISQADYRDVIIPTNSTVYCDIPYKGTKQYVCGAFNHEEFYEWVRTRDFPVYISEYTAPDDFVSVWSKEHYSSFGSSQANSKAAKRTTEQVFVHERWATEQHTASTQPTNEHIQYSLFDDIA